MTNVPKTLLLGQLVHGTVEAAVKSAQVRDVVIFDDASHLLQAALYNRLCTSHVLPVDTAMPFHEALNQYNSRKPRKGKKK